MKSKKVQTPTELYTPKRRLSTAENLVYYFGLLLTVAGTVIAISGFLLFASFVLSFIGTGFNTVFNQISPNHEDIFQNIKPFKNVIDGFFSMVIGGIISGTGGFLQRLVKPEQNKLSTNVTHNNNTNNRTINMGMGNYNESISGNYIQGNYINSQQNLATTVAEIQLLLKQLEQTYPTTTTSQQMVVAAEAINRIESNPTFKKRVINAAKEGGLAAFEKAIDNPAGAFIVGAIKGWQEVEAED
ncbi:hypothetical protein [Nostoc sp. C117]|uniref:hypothetical protein n=1 Tax=Nostoc sp. C117 TaxID=3349875 RepID=UPI00370D63B9